MNDATKVEFCSRAWIAAAREYLLGESRDVDLTGVDVSFNEVFTDPPARLDPDGVGRIGWYLRVADGRVEVGEGILPHADLRLTVDYATVLPAARWLSSDPPLPAAIQVALGKAIQREGNTEAMAAVPWMGFARRDGRANPMKGPFRCVPSTHVAATSDASGQRRFGRFPPA